jgi:hypothetical protein
MEIRIFGLIFVYCLFCSYALAEEQVDEQLNTKLNLGFNLHDTYPSLENRELGSPVIDEQTGEKRVWNRALPFLAQDVIDLGFDLPNPYGIAVIPGWVRQDLILDSLSIAINGGSRQAIDFVDFGTPFVENRTVQLKLDAWLFPFMNVYATVGKLDGDGSIPLTILGSDLLDFLGQGALCEPAIKPQFCSRTLSAMAKPEYHGDNFSVGINLATGWDRFFVTIPVTYAWSNVNIIDSTVEAFTASPRIGVIGDIGEKGKLSAYLGAMYLDVEVDLTGRVTFDTSDPDVPGIGDRTTVDFSITQRNKDKWNALLGFNWDVDSNWAVQAEAGFGGSRESFISSATYRF